MNAPRISAAKVYVDTVGDPDRYERHLTAHFSGRIRFAVRKKADSLFACVSAASICAKVRAGEPSWRHASCEWR